MYPSGEGQVLRQTGEGYVEPCKDDGQIEQGGGGSRKINHRGKKSRFR